MPTTKYTQQKLRQGTLGHFSFREREMLDATERMDPVLAIATQQTEGTIAECFSFSFLQ